MSYITNKQLEALREAEVSSRIEFNHLLYDYTNIEAVPYTAYIYKDAFGDYLGDSSADDTVEDILRNAYIEVLPDND